MKSATRTVMSVLGMRNNECRERVSEALAQVSGVSEVSVNLFRASATVVHDAACPRSELLDAVARAGYGAKVAS